MDGQPASISPTELYARLSTAAAPILVDVGPAIPTEGDRLIVAAFYRPPDDIKRWSELVHGRPVVVYGRQGHELSQEVAATPRGATPHDIKGVEFTHEGDRCSFDTILRIYDIKDPTVAHLTDTVRGADTSRHDLTPQCGRLFAISPGLSANFPDDHDMLKHGMIMYDALYTWVSQLAGRNAQLAGEGASLDDPRQ